MERKVNFISTVCVHLCVRGRNDTDWTFCFYLYAWDCRLNSGLPKLLPLPGWTAQYVGERASLWPARELRLISVSYARTFFKDAKITFLTQVLGGVLGLG